MNKILSIQQKVLQESKLPDGIYFGLWSGYNIDLNYNNSEYQLTTEVGVKGINIKVIVEVKDGVTTFNTTNN